MQLIKKIVKKILPHGLMCAYISNTLPWSGYSIKKKGHWIPIEKRYNECIVVANGPSVKQHEQELIQFAKNRDVITINHSIYTQIFEKLQPFIHVIADTSFFINHQYDPLRKKMDTFYKKINSLNKLIFAVPHYHYAFVKTKIYNPLITLMSYPTLAPANYTKLLDKKFQNGVLGFGAQTVSVCALYLAMMANYKRIYLIGLDLNNSFSIDQYCRVLLKDEHFYDSNIFVYKKSYLHTEHYLPTANVHIELQLAQFYANSNNIDVINLSLESCIDIFKKGTFSGIVYPFKPQDKQVGDDKYQVLPDGL